LERENQRMRTELYEVDKVVGPLWLTHPERIKRLLELDRAKVELTALRYQLAFKLPRDSDGGDANAAPPSRSDDSAGPEGIAQGDQS
jgi:hypothetical protein